MDVTLPRLRHGDTVTAEAFNQLADSITNWRNLSAPPPHEILNQPGGAAVDRVPTVSIELVRLDDDIEADDSDKQATPLIAVTPAFSKVW